MTTAFENQINNQHYSGGGVISAIKWSNSCLCRKHCGYWWKWAEHEGNIPESAVENRENVISDKWGKTKYLKVAKDVIDKLKDCLSGFHAQAGLVEDQGRDREVCRSLPEKVGGERMESISCQQWRTARNCLKPKEVSTASERRFSGCEKTWSTCSHFSCICLSFSRDWNSNIGLHLSAITFKCLSARAHTHTHNYLSI